MKLSLVNAAVLTALAAGQVHAESDVITFEEVVVTANKYEESLSETAGSVAVIEGKTLQKEGATELYDSLDKEPGVSVTGGAGRPQNITIRGMTGNRIVIVKDGISLSDGFGASDLNDSAGRNSFDVSSLKQIQVVKGASSTSYGSGAIGGVVILQSNTPEDLLDGENFYADVNGTYTGISNKYRGSSNLAFRSGNTSSLLSAAYWIGEETRNYQQDLYNREVDGVSAEYAIHHQVTDQWLMKAKAEMYSEAMERVEGTASIQPDGIWSIQDFYQENTTESYLFWLGAEYQAEHAWMDKLDSKIYYRSTEFEEYNNRLMSRENLGITEQRREQQNRSFRDELIGWSADFDKEIDAGDIYHTLVYGAVIETAFHERPVNKTVSDWNGTSEANSYPFAPARTYSMGMFVQDAMTIQNWTVMLGLRFDAHQLTADKEDAIGVDGLEDNSSTELSPSASIAYQFTPNFNSYLSYKHGYRAPEYDKVYGYANHDFVPITPFVVLPNYQLEAETSDSFELGAKYDDGSLRVYGAVFYNMFENFIDVVDTGFNQSTGLFEKRYENLSDVESYGAEATIEYLIARDWTVSSKVGWVDGKDANDEYIRSITPLEGNVGLDYDDSKFNGYLRLNWADAMDRTPSCADTLGIQTDCAQTAGWATVDLGIGYDFSKDFYVNANLINVFDKEYVRYQDVAGLIDSQTRFSTEPGRYFTVNAHYAF
ncbi:TonB-dependent hemoglobin/transferrin/lactoferrin family receptor [Vibrio sp. SCSIO 43135]|uniref:TonB-dependent hemoglobin/transferrin/lactoferrin family receptor n=1 Tax=Vibrio sp. SCSIO 43135 TaxID=2819096 RepID=UPI002074B9BA|nr:TonB-dependent hemoglobin/transferrin/lactoferrin family receptor [Vibrio sp. SCSIO 43135]USD42881.1 TonB-dependent hemoglobin/transferrin/lactoferrin family receptor [Vibrio sp. SCSIO 43135]